MWQLKIKTKTAKDWVEVGTFDSMTAAAARICELEGAPTTGVFLEVYVDTVHGTDDEAFSLLHHTGRQALYGIRRTRPN